MSNLIDIQEASKKLNLKTSTLYKYISSRKIPHVKLGARVLFSEDRLDEWVKEHSVEPILKKSVI